MGDLKKGNVLLYHKKKRTSINVKNYCKPLLHPEKVCVVMN